MNNYIVLRDINKPQRQEMQFESPLEGMRPVARPSSREELESTLPKPLINIQELDGNDVRDAEKDPTISQIARILPTRLIEPVKKDINVSGAHASWGIQAVFADQSPYSGGSVVPCVLDTGIDENHPAFNGVQLLQQDFSGDGNGDIQGHGTHCAGTVFGRDVNGQRIGVAPDVQRALIGKVLGDNGGGTTEMLVKGMLWAESQGANIISMSLGFDIPGWIKSMIDDGMPEDLAASIALKEYLNNIRLYDSIIDMFNARAPYTGGVLVVAASGNESKRDINPNYEVGVSMPACAKGVLSVGALGNGQNGYYVPNFSNTDPILSAPGVDIVSAQTGTTGLTSMSGTSMATPHVAGLAALWWEKIAASGNRVTAEAVKSHLRAHSITNVFAGDVDINDRGEGMSVAPYAFNMA